MGGTYSSFRRSLSLARPMFSAISWNMILMKMRLLEVVSSSVRLMYPSSVHGKASVYSRCAKNRPTLRSLRERAAA